MLKTKSRDDISQFENKHNMLGMTQYILAKKKAEHAKYAVGTDDEKHANACND